MSGLLRSEEQRLLLGPYSRQSAQLPRVVSASYLAYYSPCCLRFIRLKWWKASLDETSKMLWAQFLGVLRRPSGMAGSSGSGLLQVMTNLGSILKSRDIALPTKVCLVKAMIFPVVMYGCESWTIKKAERQRIDAFELWCWRRLLKVPWTARRPNLKEISPEYTLEGLMLKLQL